MHERKSRTAFDMIFVEPIESFETLLAARGTRVGAITRVWGCHWGYSKAGTQKIVANPTPYFHPASPSSATKHIVG